MYIAKELWHGRSARELSPKDVGRGMWRSINELMLVRYDYVYYRWTIIIKTQKVIPSLTRNVTFAGI